MWKRGLRWQGGTGGGERWGSKVGKVGDRGEVARWERWGREVRCGLLRLW